jgi:hypothetical protein
MTTDTAEFCAHLNGELVELRATMAWPSPIARRLASEGRQFCAAGLYRAGVARLRRALILLRHGG